MKTWIFNYYGWFGDGDSSDDIEYETDVTEKEYEILDTVEKYNNDELDIENFNLDEYVNEHQEIINTLEQRINEEIYECEKENYTDEDEMPSICVRYPWA